MSVIDELDNDIYVPLAVIEMVYSLEDEIERLREELAAAQKDADREGERA